MNSILKREGKGLLSPKVTFYIELSCFRSQRKVFEKGGRNWSTNWLKNHVTIVNYFYLIKLIQKLGVLVVYTFEQSDHKKHDFSSPLNTQRNVCPQ